MSFLRSVFCCTLFCVPESIIEYLLYLLRLSISIAITFSGHSLTWKLQRGNADELSHSALNPRSHCGLRSIARLSCFASPTTVYMLEGRRTAAKSALALCFSVLSLVLSSVLIRLCHSRLITRAWVRVGFTLFKRGRVIIVSLLVTYSLSVSSLAVSIFIVVHK